MPTTFPLFFQRNQPAAPRWHTALDSVSRGINDWLARGLLNGKFTGVVDALKEPTHRPDGSLEGGVGRLVRLDNEMEMQTLQEMIKQHIGVSHRAFILNQLGRGGVGISDVLSFPASPGRVWKHSHS